MLALVFGAIALASVTGCGRDTPSGGEEGVLLVAVAQSLQGQIESAVDLFHDTHPGVEVSWTYGGSGALAHQILAGAPIDVFVSASDREMDRVEQGGKVLSGTRQAFIRNGMVLVAAESVSSETLGGWQDLGKERIRRIAIGDPDTVPAGMYADQILDRLGLSAAVKPKLILGGNVRQVLDYVARGEADAGVVFTTDVESARTPVRVVAGAPADTHDPIRYPMAVMSESRYPELAREFLAVLASPETQTVLEREGFVRPQ